MPLSVRLQDERGKPVIPQDAGIELTIIPDNNDLKLLQYINPYGDTYFNTLQMEDFLSDWDKLKPSADQQKSWEIVREMAIRCRKENHPYLRFIGD